MGHDHTITILLAWLATLIFLGVFSSFKTQEQDTADAQITSGIIANMSTETKTRNGKTETKYTISVKGTYVYKNETKEGETQIDVPLSFYLSHKIGDSVTEAELSDISSEPIK